MVYVGNMTSVQITGSLHLAVADVPRTSAAKPAPQPTNHYVVIDCSGSMWSDLPLLRAQLKAKLPRLIDEQDTITIVWFSGRGEFGTLVEHEPVATLKDLGELNKAIDRWLKPMGLTGFKQPLEEVSRLIDKHGGVSSLFFMSDGYDNQWGREEILQAVRQLADKVSSATFVEYGYYCNHPLLVSMAETAGGDLIFNEGFREYEPSFEAAMQKRAMGAKRIEVEIKADAVRGFAFAIDGDSLLTFKIEGGKVSVPEHIEKVWFLSPAKVGRDLEAFDQGILYAAIALYAQRVDSDVVLPLLKHSGDVHFIELFSGCFGKQRYAAFVDAAKAAVFNPDLRLTKGFDPNKVPPDDAFTTLDLLRILADDEGNYLLIDSEDFKYNRIGLRREQEVVYSDEETAKLEELNTKLASAKGPAEAKIRKEIEAIEAPHRPLKFEAQPLPNGVSISALVFNEERPNVSVQVRRTGTVNIKARKGADQKNLPDEVPTFIWRNYSIVKDGLVNVQRLPLRLTGATMRKLKEAGLPEEAIQPVSGESREVVLTRVKKAADTREVNLVLDLEVLPLINRTMVRRVSMREAIELEYALTKARAAQKVYKGILGDRFGDKVSKGFAVLYGEANADWLKEQGITDYNGFNPKGKQAQARDFYFSKELTIALKGMSTLPSLADVTKRMASGKHTVTSALMAPVVTACTQFETSDACSKAADSAGVFRAWLEGQAAAATKEVRRLLYQASQLRFSVIVGQTWFTEFSSLDENSLEVTIEGETLQGTAKLKEVETPI